MPPKLARLLDAYRQHLAVPWQAGLAAIQRVMFLVYEKEHELKLRANLGEFEITTAQAGKKWLLLDITNAFPAWLARQEYRDAYFDAPEDLAGYQNGEITEFLAHLVNELKLRIAADSDAETVVALLGAGALFGVARVSSVVEGIKESVNGRLLVFFPGEHHPETHAYRLLDARDGWNYLAVPLTARD